MPHRSTIRRPLLLATVCAVLSLCLVAVPSRSPLAQAAGYAKPTGLHAAVSAHSVALRWTAVRNAPAYRVQFSTRSDMKTFQTMDVVGTYLEWTHLNPAPSAHSARLKAGTAYYFRVKVISLAKATLTHYSKTLKVKTASAKAMPELAPVSLAASPQSASAMYLSWSSRGPGVKYRIRYGTTPKLEMAKSATVTSAYSGTVLKKLTAATTYYYKVRTISTGGTDLSGYSKTSSLTTPTTSGSPPITVATYNVCSVACDAEGHPWAGAREAAVVANLAAQSPDIVALQEMDRSKLAAFLSDLNKASGRSYQTSDPASKGGSGTTRLAYDTGRFTMASADHGVLPLSVGDSASRKYSVWAILTDKLSGKRLFVVANHLIAGSAYQDLRRTQTDEIVNLVAAKNTKKLPVVIAGDFNSNRDASPSNVVYDVLSAAGYQDPLGNTDKSWTVAKSATAEHRVDLDYSTYNNFEPYARCSKYSNGADIDYIWHSPKIRVTMTQVVVAVDTAGRFVGTIPSDHNLLTATIHLP